MAPRSTSVAAPRSRRGRRPAMVIAAVALLVLMGRGLGFVGRSEAPAGGEDPTATAPTQVPPPTPAPAPTAPPASPAPALEPAPPASQPALDADRFASLCSVLEVAVANGEPGDALAALQHLRSLPLDEPQRAALAAGAAPVEQALAETGARIVQGLCQGRVLAVCPEVKRFVASGPAAAAWLDDALRAGGFRTRFSAALAGGDRVLPIARSLPTGRAVRFAHDGRTGEGTVVDGTSGAVTLRLPSPGGVTFPTLARCHVEPVDATGDEAVEMAFAALQAGDLVLARLWAAVGASRLGAARPERAQRLLQLLE